MVRVKKFISLLFIPSLLILFLTLPPPSVDSAIYGGEEDDENIFAESPEQVEGTESCFQYYQYGKISANISSDKTIYSPGDKIRLYGLIKNDNTYPVTDTILYSLLKRFNSNPSPQGDNDNFLVDRIILKEDLNFLPNEKKYLEVEVPVLAEYMNGEYKLEYFLLSKQGFHYSGLPFLEGDMAGSSGFRIENSQAPDVYFDIDNFRVNGKKENIRQYGVSFTDSQFNFELPVIDKRLDKTDLSVNVKYYYFEDDLEMFLEKEEAYVLKRDNQVLKTSFVIPRQMAEVYVITAEIKSPAKSVFKYRFYKTGEFPRELRINDLNVTDYPLKDGSRAYLCFHSPATVFSPETEVVLSVLDSGKALVESKKIRARFPGSVLAISVPIDKLKSRNDFYIQANLTDSRESREIVKHYSDDLFRNVIDKIDIIYDSKNPNQLILLPKNIKGETVRSGGFVEYIKIKDKNGNTIQEKNILTDFESPFILGNLKRGTYTAEAGTDDLISKTDFRVEKDIKGSTPDGYFDSKIAGVTKGKRDITFLVVSAVIFLCILIIIGVVIIRNKLRFRNKNI